MKYIQQVNEIALTYVEQDISIDKYSDAAYELAMDYVHKGRLNKNSIFNLGIIAGQAWCIAQNHKRIGV